MISKHKDLAIYPSFWLIFELLATYIGAFIVKKSEKYIFSFLPDQLK